MKTLAAICLLLISQALAEISVDVGDAERGVNLLNPRSGRPLYQLRVLDAQDTVEADDLVYVSLKANDNSRPITNFHVSIQSPDECGAGKIAHGIRGEEAPIKQDGVTVTTKVNVDWTKVPLRWRTPSCGCVTIRATVWESDSVYHQDEGVEGPLTRTLCIVVPDTESETVDSLEVEDEVSSETEVEEAEVQGEDIDEDEEEEDPEEVFWRSPAVPKVKKTGGCRGQDCPLHPVFIAPRGANTEQVDEVCLLLQNKPVNQEDMPAYLANRIQSLEVCCEMEGETRSTCINDLRSENVRDICEVSTKYTPHGRYGLSHPCCTGNSDDRLECFDQERNGGFDSTLHSVNRTDELVRFHMTMKKIARLPYMPRMEASIVQRKCEWIMSREGDMRTPHQFMKGYYKSQMMKYEVCCMKESQEDRISCVEELLRQKVDNYCVDRSLDREDPTNPRALEPINPCCHQPRSERYECFHQIANSSWSGKNSSRTCYKFLIKNYRTARQVWLDNIKPVYLIKNYRTARQVWFDNIKPVLSPEEHGVLVSNKLWCMSEGKKSHSVPWFIAYSKFMAPRGSNTVAVDNICDITMATLTGEEPDLEDVPAENTVE
ncbi:hypothetical protein Bbelb_329090 [Branchiostoma belcheri]|nr:hypothetical protein Bbelb_329090 [Branchiostoma belcheri]